MERKKWSHWKMHSVVADWYISYVSESEKLGCTEIKYGSISWKPFPWPFSMTLKLMLNQEGVTCINVIFETKRPIVCICSCAQSGFAAPLSMHLLQINVNKSNLVCVRHHWWCNHCCLLALLLLQVAYESSQMIPSSWAHHCPLTFSTSIASILQWEHAMILFISNRTVQRMELVLEWKLMRWAPDHHSSSPHPYGYFHRARRQLWSSRNSPLPVTPAELEEEDKRANWQHNPNWS